MKLWDRIPDPGLTREEAEALLKDAERVEDAVLRRCAEDKLQKALWETAHKEAA